MREVYTVMTGLVLALTALQAEALVWYVDAAGGDPAGDATSWATAVPTLRDAAEAAEAGGEDHPTFWLTAATQEGRTGDDRFLDTAEYTFDTVAIFGGFDGNETSPDARPAGQRTTLTLPPGGDFIGGIRSNVSELVLSALHFGAMTTLQDYGAAVHATAGEVSVYNCVFEDGEAALGGGAIAMRLGSSLEADNCVFMRNGAGVTGPESATANGGDILLSSDPGEFVSGTAPTATLTDCRLEAGVASEDGGSVYVDAGAVLTATRCTFASAFASQQGGAIFAATHPDTAVTLIESALDHCTADEDAGGALAGDDGVTVLVLDSRFVANQAPNGGAIWLDGCAGELTGTDFIGNVTASSSVALSNPVGGAVLMRDSALPVTDCRFIANRAGNSDTSDAHGGALSQNGPEGDNRFEVTNTLFQGNHSVDGDGGALYSEGSTLAVEGCRFIGNRADRGGGLRALTQGQGAYLVESTFQGNVAAFGGGAELDDGIQQVARCRFEANVASSGTAGAVASTDSDPLQLINCLFADNTGDEATTVDILLANQGPQVAYCTFAGHTQYVGAFASEDGALIRLLESPVTMEVTSCIFNGPRLFALGTGAVTVDHSHVVDLPLETPAWFTNGTGNITGDPYFFDPQREDWRPTPSSPGVDAANPNSLPGEDIRGVERPRGAGPDMGAYELDEGTDRDLDRIPDLEEGTGDSDNDGVPDYLDPDNNPPMAGDLNNDRRVNAIDVQAVINIVLGVPIG